jgi:F-type H+-transporting ATPase subunit delta
MLNKAVSSAGKEEISRLNNMLCSRGKATLLPEIAELVNGMVAQAESSVDVDVTSAVALTPESQKALASELSSETGKKAHLIMHTDKSILGGMIIRIGDRKIDCSVRGRLDGLKRTIVS